VELDFAGFVMALPQYWSFDGEYNEVVKLFLVFMPLSYLYAAVRCWLDSSESVEDQWDAKQSAAVQAAKKSAEQEERRKEEERKTGQNRGSQPGRPQHAPRPEDAAVRFCTSDQGQLNVHGKRGSSGRFGGKGIAPDTHDMMTVRDKPTVRWYHLCPLARLYLVVNNLKSQDIEIVFRMNSLSSFSLGVGQLICMCFTVLLAGEPLNLIVMINIVSQIINWTITIIYFATSAADAMKKSIVVSAVSDRLRKRQQKEMIEFFETVHKVAAKLAEGDVPLREALAKPVCKEEFHDMHRLRLSLVAEVECLINCNVDMSRFSVGELFRFRAKLYKRIVNNLARL